MSDDQNTKRESAEERLAKLERIGDDLASIAMLAVDPADFDDPEAQRRDLRECAEAWNRARGRG